MHFEVDGGRFINRWLAQHSDQVEKQKFNEPPGREYYKSLFDFPIASHFFYPVLLQNIIKDWFMNEQ